MNTFAAHASGGEAGMETVREASIAPTQQIASDEGTPANVATEPPFHLRRAPPTHLAEPRSRFSDWSSVHSVERGQRLTARAALALKKRASLRLTLPRSSRGRQKQRQLVPNVEQDARKESTTEIWKEKEAGNSPTRLSSLISAKATKQGNTKRRPFLLFQRTSDCRNNSCKPHSTPEQPKTSPTASSPVSSSRTYTDTAPSDCSPATSSQSTFVSSPTSASQSTFSPVYNSDLLPRSFKRRYKSWPAIPEASTNETISSQGHSSSFCCPISRPFGKSSRARTVSVCSPAKDARVGGCDEEDSVSPTSPQALKYQRSLWYTLDRGDLAAIPADLCCFDAQANEGQQQQQGDQSLPNGRSDGRSCTPLPFYRNHFLDPPQFQEQVEPRGESEDALLGQEAGSKVKGARQAMEQKRCVSLAHILLQDSPLDALTTSVASFQIQGAQTEVANTPRSIRLGQVGKKPVVHHGTSSKPPGAVPTPSTSATVAWWVSDEGLKKASRSTTPRIPPCSPSASLRSSPRSAAPPSASPFCRQGRANPQQCREPLPVVPRPLLCPALYRRVPHHCNCRLEAGRRVV